MAFEPCHSEVVLFPQKELDVESLRSLYDSVFSASPKIKCVPEICLFLVPESQLAILIHLASFRMVCHSEQVSKASCAISPAGIEGSHR